MCLAKKNIHHTAVSPVKRLRKRMLAGKAYTKINTNEK